MSESLQVSDDGLPILTQFSEDGFVDCVFRIHDLSHEPGVLRFRLLASHERSVVGFGVEMVDAIDGYLDAEMNGLAERVKRRGVTFHRTGPESDALLQALARLYGMSAPERMVDRESFTAIALHQGELDLMSEPVRIKLFGRDGDPFVEDDYYESFFNIDFPAGIVAWNEKDPDYRLPLLRGLSRDVA